MSPAKRRGLGRGLDALLTSTPNNIMDDVAQSNLTSADDSELQYLPIEQLQQGDNINDLYKQYRIWDKKKPFYQHALTHITTSNIGHAQSRLAQVDLISKSSSDFNHYLLLADVLITLYHGQTTSKYSLDYEYA